MNQQSAIISLNKILRILALIVFLMGCFWVIAWVGGWANQWSTAGNLTLKTNMAIGQTLCGIILLLVSLKNQGIFQKILGSFCSLAVFLLGFLTLGENLFNVDLGIDNLFVEESAGALATVSPNRMGLPGSLSLTILGIAFILHYLNHKVIIPYLGIVVCLINLIPAVGFILSVDIFYTLPTLTAIAWPSVVALTAAGMGLVLLQPKNNMILSLTGNEAGGILLRTILPGTFLYPLVLGVLMIKGVQLGFYDYITGIGGLIIVLILIFSIQIFWIAKILNRIDASRSTALNELRENDSRLKEARDKLAIALESGNIGVWEWDLETDGLIFDERLERMFNLKPGSFGNTYKAFENLVNEEDIPHFQKAINNAIEKNIPFESIFRTKHIKGKQKYISSKAFVSKDPDSKPIGFIGVCFDMTWMHEQTDQTVLKLNDELLRSNRELENFAYVASHDLQEPLRAISSFTQLLAKQYKDKLDDKGLEYIAFAVDGAKRMYDLLNGLLAYSRIHTKGKSFTKVDMNRVLSNVTKNLTLNIRESKAILKISELPEIYADETQMIQLFQNLIANAIKFNTSVPKIIVSSKTQKNQFVFSVKDNGIGIENQFFNKIFLIFQRLLPKEKYEGTGIGLAICRRIVERHGGTIWVESEPQKGSVFYFTIPK